MWCKNCSRETNEDVCSVCGIKTEEDIPHEICWCDKCKIPLIKAVNGADHDTCSLCGGKASYLVADLRPVFPEERLLLEIISDRPLDYINKSVWASNNRYYIDGNPTVITSAWYKKYTAEYIKEQLEKYKNQNSYDFFNKNVSKFVRANQGRLDYLKYEANVFIQESADKYPRENIVLSFSGGKDSTVTADLVVKALSDPSLVHIFANTTLEFPSTIEYAERFKKNNPKVIFKIAKNKEQDFYNVCEDLGPPARMLRWCCFMFKTGPIYRIISSLYRDENILTYYGIRKFESNARSKYNRIEDNAESTKIQQQTVATPIFFWKDIDVWLYILGEDIDFNDAYRLGYDRVGCWCCPNNNKRAEFLSQIYMSDQFEKWHTFLVDFAKRIGKPDPEEYIESGKWKARQGGNGIAAASDIKIRFTNCTTENNAKVYQLNKPMDDSFVGLFTPFGRIAPELGRKMINEIIIVDLKTNVPIISIQSFSQEGFEYAVKIKTMNVARHDDLQRMISYQIKKFNACRKCLKCESLCKHGAISIIGNKYTISDNKCKRCKMCVTAKYLDGGCLMDRYLRTKE